MDNLYLPRSPAQRAIVAAAITTAAIWYIRPPAFFREDTGQPRVATWIARPDQVGRATPLPWWLAVAGVALAVDLFI